MRYGRRPLVGIGGWLAVLVVVLAVTSPMSTAFAAWRDWTYFSAGPGGRPIATSLVLVAAVEIGVEWTLAWRLLAWREWRTIRIVIAALWTLGITDIVLRTVAVSVALHVPVLGILAGAGLGQVRPIAFCAIWTAYLLRSDRVANTYAGPADQLADVFG